MPSDGQLPGRARPSHKILDTHAVGSICNDDFGVFTVTNIATENTDAVSPAHGAAQQGRAPGSGRAACTPSFHVDDMPPDSTKLFATKVMPRLKSIRRDWDSERFWIRPLPQRAAPGRPVPELAG